jgi:hypothetical protein
MTDAADIRKRFSFKAVLNRDSQPCRPQASRVLPTEHH